MVKTQKRKKPKVNKDVAQLELSYTASRIINQYNHSGKLLGVSTNSTDKLKLNTGKPHN